MKTLTTAAFCLLASYIVVEIGRKFYQNYKVRNIVLSFFKERRQYISSYLRILIREDEYITENGLEKFHADLLEDIVDHVSTEELVIISNYLREPRTLKEEINRYNYFLIKSKIINRPLKLATYPLERINQ